MRWSLAIAFAHVVAAALMSASTSRASNDAECVPSTHEETVHFIKDYMDAFVSHSPEGASAVALSDDARRSNIPPSLPRKAGGPVNARSGEQIRSAFYSFAPYYLITGYGGLRVVAEECESVAFIWLEARIPGAYVLTEHLGIRLRISSGFIEQIEVLSARDEGVVNGSCWPASDDPDEGRTQICHREPTTDPLAPVAGCTTHDRTPIIHAALGYLDAVGSHNASAVALAATARRTEMTAPAGSGPVTGTSADEIRYSLEHDDRFQVATGVRDRRLTVEEGRCQVIAHYLVDVTPTATQHHVTRFTILNGEIYEIEDIWVPPVAAGALEGSCWPQGWSNVDDETYRFRACPVGSE